jgi:ubiquinone/menaquinone biosynthesis C-methylase UbiE
MSKYFQADKLNALQAKEQAQWIAFAPFVFQASRVLRDTGILDVLASNNGGLTQEEVVEKTKLPAYGVRVLLEAGLGMRLVVVNDGKYTLTKTAFFLISDELTRANMDFVHDVCYQGMFHLEESIRNQKPEGLKVFGSWSTIYEALSKLPKQVQKSWFGFDHYYSDHAFPDALPLVFKNKPGTLLDIGGNTGKWSLKCVEYDPDVIVTIMDLPGQVGMAKAEIEAKGFSHRINFFECNLLDESQPFPKNFDAIWMSQFLDCFGEDEIVSILERARRALAPGGQLYIVETYWDNQQHAAARFVLTMTSLYFACLANGNSKMYLSDDMRTCVQRAGFRIERELERFSASHTMYVCRST